MRTRLVLVVGFAVIAVLLVGTVIAWPLNSTPPPQGISPTEWHPIANDLGLYLHDTGQGRFIGYIMAYRNDQWVRVTLYDPSVQGVLPAR